VDIITPGAIMHAGGPKPKYTKKVIKELKANIDAYTITEDIPILKEICFRLHVPSKHVYDFPELSDSIKRLIDKKEAMLERKALEGKVDKTMAIFSLKQLGWKDRQDISFDSGDEISKAIHDLIKSNPD
jgi:hypothetical protein